MTDRVQQMLDAVKENFEAATRKPRLRRLKRGVGTSMRAEVREGILKHPYLPSGKAPLARGLQETQTGFSGPRHPDVWRDAPVQTASHGGRSAGGRSTDDPADAALAAFKAAKLRTARGRSSETITQDGLSFDRPRMDESLASESRGRRRSGVLRKRKLVEVSSPGPHDNSKSLRGATAKSRRRGIRALLGLGKRS